MRSLASYLAHGVAALLGLALVQAFRRRAAKAARPPQPIAGGSEPSEGSELDSATLRLWPHGAVALALAAVTFLVSEPRGDVWQDFTDAYYAAGAATLRGQSAVVRLFEHGVHGFVNLPVLGYLFAPFALLRERPAALAFTLLGIAAIVWCWRLLVDAARLDPGRAALLALLFAVNGPLWNSVREGNTTHFTLLAVTVALRWLREDRDVEAGAMLGAAALFKLPLLLFGPYLLLRRRWRAAAGGALVLGAVVALSLATFGVSVHRQWYAELVAGSGTNPIAAFNNQSVAAFAARLSRGITSLWDWKGQPMDGAARLVVGATTAAMLLVGLGVALVWRRAPAGGATVSDVYRLDRLGPERDLEISIVLTLACTTSPLAWSHYYALLLLPMAFLLSASLPPTVSPLALATDGPGSPTARRARALGVVAIALLSLPVVWPPEELRAAGAWGALYTQAVSHFLLGGLVMLTLLVWLRVRLAHADEPAA